MWVPDANVSRIHTDILTVINYYRMLANGIQVVLFAPVRLEYGGKKDSTVYPSIAAIIARKGPRRICIKNSDHQIYEGPPNFVVEIESKYGFTDMRKKLRLYEAVGVQEALFLEQGMSPTWYQLQDRKFQVIAQESSGVVLSRALPGFTIDFEKFKYRKWLEMMDDIKESVGRLDMNKELVTEYGL